MRQQLKRINKSQTQLRQLKQEVNAKLKNLNQPNNDFGLDEAAAIGLHLFGKLRIARDVTRQGNRIELQDRKQQKNARQPHIKMSNLIDNYILEGDRLKTMAQNYLKEQSK